MVAFTARRAACAAVVLLLLACAPTTRAHICMWQPMQRSNFSITTPGDPNCYRKVGPCGGINTVGPTITKLTSGDSYEVQFQQNLNHFNEGKPGDLVVDYASTSHPTEADFKSFPDHDPIPDYNAMNEISRVNITMAVKVPTVASATAAVFRVRYRSNNPLENDRGEIFYQCADVMLLPRGDADAVDADARPVPVPSPQPSSQTQPPPQDLVPDDDQIRDCCAPRSFSTQFTYSDPPAKGVTYYDYESQMMRVDVTTGAGTAGTANNGQFSMWLNFTTPSAGPPAIEWYYNKITGTCDEYGLDQWIEWCFGGAAYGQKYAGSRACFHSSCDVFTSGDWTYGAYTESCLPAFINGSMGISQTITYFNAVVGPVPKSVFTPAPACKAHHATHSSAAKLGPVVPSSVPTAETEEHPHLQYIAPHMGVRRLLKK